MTYFICWIVNGGPTQSIGLLVVTTSSFRVTILDFTSLALKRWLLSLKTGNVKIIGYFHPSRKLVSHMRACKAAGTLVIPMWKQEIIRGQRGILPVQALGYVKFGKVIFRRPFGTEVRFQNVCIKATAICCLKNHSKFCL